MIAELDKGYAGVFCKRCREPIPVTSKLESIHYDEIEDESAARTFIARCRLCEYESVYVVNDIQRFDGKPHIRRSRAAGAG